MTPFSTGTLIRRTHTLYRTLTSPFPSSQFNLPAAFKRMSSSQAKRLAGKTILVTGASSGIGKSTALEFARTQPDDLKLILTARREDALKEARAACKIERMRVLINNALASMRDAVNQ